MRVVLLLAILAFFAFVPTANAQQPQPNTQPVELCRVSDKRLGELSGLASDGRRWYAVNDGGTRLSVVVLTKDCRVERVIGNRADPFDVEDMARGKDGAFWLADIGDNRKQRDTIALHKLSTNGNAALYRLSYPDGPHDAETLLIGRDGVPYLVTKPLLGPAGVYRPAGELASPGPTVLARVGEVTIRGTDTPGGPTNVPKAIGSTLITGGAVNADGTVVALRTYNDAYLYPAPDGDIVAALGREPVRIPLPNEQQGEAIAFEPDGTLLSGTEGVGQPIRAIPGAAQLAARTGSPSPQGGAEPNAGSGGSPEDGGAATTVSDSRRTLTVGVAAVVVLGLLMFLRKRRRRQ